MISASPRRLAVFKNVVDLGGFNAAASRLGIAQPSVGAHVKGRASSCGISVRTIG
jgi:DNA-binding transcriptional LysR family regulator